jgi:hypothetical protein
LSFYTHITHFQPNKQRDSTLCRTSRTSRSALYTLLIYNAVYDPAVWGELVGVGFECDADCAQCIYERQDDENVQEGQIGYLCKAHVGNYSNGSTPFKPARKNKKKMKK